MHRRIRDLVLSAKTPSETEDLQQRAQRLEKHDWHVRLLSAFVSILLTSAVAVLAARILSFEGDSLFQHQLRESVQALVGLVLVFNTYAVYQHFQLNRIRRELVTQQIWSEELERAVLYDSLTGLYNRRFAEVRLAEEIARAKRYGSSLTVMCLDLDDFKSINDQLGHAAGDEALKGFAAHLKKSIRFSDMAVRLGGDEFLVMLPECRRELAAETIRRISNGTFSYKGVEYRLRASVGVAAYDFNEDESVTGLVRRADQAMYADKKSASRVA